MIDQKIVEYIKNSLTQGKTKEELYKELLGQGWTIEDIQASFDTIDTIKEKENIPKKTINIIVTIGAILIGMGIFSFIATKWSGMTKLTKMIIILISMVASYGGGWYLKEKLKFTHSGNALILLGSIIYGAGIFLAIQIFNAVVSQPSSIALWMIGVAVMAFVIKSHLLFSLAIFLSIYALIGYPFSILTYSENNISLLAPSFLLLISAVITFVIGWAIRKKIPPELKKIY